MPRRTKPIWVKRYQQRQRKIAAGLARKAKCGSKPEIGMAHKKRQKARRRIEEATAVIVEPLDEVLENPASSPEEVSVARRRLYAWHRHLGAGRYQAMVAAGMVSNPYPTASVREKVTREAEALDADPIVQESVKFLTMDAKVLARSSLPMMVKKVAELALEGKSEKTQLAAAIAIMDRAGLPARSEVVAGEDIAKLEGKEREELERRLTEIIEAARARRSAGDPERTGVEEVREELVALPEDPRGDAG